MRDAAPPSPPRSAAAERALARAEPPGQARRAEDGPRGADGPRFEDALAEPRRPATPPGQAKERGPKEDRATEKATDAPAEGAPAAVPSPAAPADIAALFAAVLAEARGEEAPDADAQDEPAQAAGEAPAAALPSPAAGVASPAAAGSAQTAAAIPVIEAGAGAPQLPPAGGEPVVTPSSPVAADPALPAQEAATAPGTVTMAAGRTDPHAPAVDAKPPEDRPAEPAARAEAPGQAKPTDEPPGPREGEKATDPGRGPERAAATFTPAEPPPREPGAPPPGLDTAARAASGPSPAAQPAPPAPAIPVLHGVPLGAVPVEIGLKAMGGTNRFEIRLDPGDLGRIDVSLEIAETGEVKARLMVERVETLAMLQRDARTLERAFEQAGLKAGDGAVEMHLRDPGQERQDGRPDGRGDRGRDDAPGRPPGPAADRLPPSPPPQARPLWRGSAGIDVRI